VGHPAVDNKTPFAFAPLFLADEQGQPVLTALVKGTFAIGADGRCQPAEEPVPINLEGEHHGEPETSSYRFEPEVAFMKPATDVVLLGHACATRAGTTEGSVGLRVGALQKQALVAGDRVWWKSLGQVSASKPRPYEKIPLRWERAFGGWDRSHPDPARHACEARNPVGVGMRPSRSFEEGLRLPNIEDPQQPLKRFGDTPPPAGFGFVSPHWQPRAALAGTFDEKWQKERAPLLPRNFDRRHLNAAAPGLVAAGYLRGDEAVVAAGVTPQGTLRFALPGVPPPVVRTVLQDGADEILSTNLDTVIIDADEKRVLLLWRACRRVPTGPTDVKAIEVLETAPGTVR
jgi:hypothetical protein